MGTPHSTADAFVTTVCLRVCVSVCLRVCVCVCSSASKIQGGRGEFPTAPLKREDSDNMDKHYWMTRANEVGLPHHHCLHMQVCLDHSHYPTHPPAVTATAAVHRVLV